MRKLIYLVALVALLFMPSKSYSEPIKIAQYNEITVPVICHNKEAFLEVVSTFAKEGQYEGLLANRMNMRMGICYQREQGFIFQPEKIVAEVDETDWTLAGVIFEGVSQRADFSWDTMYAWVPTLQLKGVKKGNDI